VVIVHTCAVTRSRTSGAPTIRRLETRTPRRRDHRHRVRRADQPGPLCRHAGSRSRCRQRRHKCASTPGRKRKIFSPASAIFGAGPHEKIAVNDIKSVRETAAHLIEGFDGAPAPTSRCRTARPIAVRFVSSRSAGTPVSAMGDVVEGGAPPRQQRIIVRSWLTGVDLTSYGGRPARHAKARHLWSGRFSRHVGGLRRLRLSSLDCIEIDGRPDGMRSPDEETTDAALASVAAAGDDLILKRMKRRHCARMPLRSPGAAAPAAPALCSGRISFAGFPTETEDSSAVPRTDSRNAGSPICTSPTTAAPGTPPKTASTRSRSSRNRARRLRRHGEAARAATSSTPK